jgi:transposase
MKRTIIEAKRREARRLRQKGWSIRKIARCLVCSPSSVRRWLAMAEAELKGDRRGWRRGRMRKHSQLEKERVIEIRQEKERAAGRPLGAGAIQAIYRRRFGQEISRWFINETLRAYKKERHLLPAERHLLPAERPVERLWEYPLARLKRLGKVIVRAEFIRPAAAGEGQPPLNFLICKYVSPAYLGIVRLLPRLSSQEVIGVFKSIWRRYAVPDLAIMDNYPAFGTNLSHPGCIGRVTLFLLNIGIKPLYDVPGGPSGGMKAERVDQVLSDVFCRRLAFVKEKPVAVGIREFLLEYGGTGTRGEGSMDIPDDPLKNRNPLFVDAFTESDLENRRVDFFMASEIFFCGP